MLLLGSLVSCNVDIVKKDNKSYDLVYLKGLESSDSVTIYSYFFGGVYYERSKEHYIVGDFEKALTYYRNGKIMSYRLYYKDMLQYYRIYNDNGVPLKYGGCGLILEDTISYDTIKIGLGLRRTLELVNPHCTS